MKKIVGIIISIVLLLAIVGYFMLGNYFFNLAINKSTVKSPNLNELSFEEREPAFMTKEIEKDWFYNESRYEQVTIKSDNLNLNGYMIQNLDSNVWVIIVHGYTSKSTDMISQAKQFYDMGYNILLPGLRGHGESEGNYIGMGWPDRRDMLKWIDLIIETDPSSQIILYGISMGASTVMMTSGENLEDNVKLIIEDCGYTSIWDEFSYQLKTNFKLPATPILISAGAVTLVRANYLISNGSAVKQLEKNKLPILFIHGSEDNYVPFSMLDELYNATSSFKEKLVIEGAGHGMASTVDPILYWDTITTFINKYLGG